MGSGFIPFAPGTAGALMAFAIWYLLFINLTVQALTITTCFLIIITTIVGIWTSSVMERYWGKDPRAVNIDEFVGTWIPLLIAPSGQYTILLAIVGFVSFRLIDIYKPLGCRWIDVNVPGGLGVMLDDILAGVYALLIVALLRLIIAF